MHVHGREERLIQAARENGVDSLETPSVLKKAKKLSKIGCGFRVEI